MSAHPFGRIPLDDRDHRDLQPVPVARRAGAGHLIGAGVLLVCGGPMIVLIVGWSIHALVRLIGWTP